MQTIAGAVSRMQAVSSWDPYTPESAGDYASGTNHTLPTNGYAKAYSGVNLDSFIKKITFQEITCRRHPCCWAARSEQWRPTSSWMRTSNAVTIRLNTIYERLKRFSQTQCLEFETVFICHVMSFKVDASVFLDANENPCNSAVQPLSRSFAVGTEEDRSAEIKGVKRESIFLGNGSDEADRSGYPCVLRTGVSTAS